MAQSEKSDCKVLLETISELYSGGCRDGLAHGNGTAKGIDEYQGNFKKGLPDGFGKYIWANGDIYDGGWKKGEKNGSGSLFTNTDRKTIYAIWKNDTIKKVLDKQYKVIRASSLSAVLIKKNPSQEPGTIQVVFDIPSSSKYYNTLDITSSSGILAKTQGRCVFRNVTFPFKAEISFVITGTSFVISKRCIAEFEIIEQGEWTVTIKE
jgi:hypothetical protein